MTEKRACSAEDEICGYNIKGELVAEVSVAHGGGWINNTSEQDDHLLKADQPHLRNYLHTPAAYRITDKHLRLVMAIIALYCVCRRTDKKL